ncbi:MAG: hypothetical protein CMM00_00605 [Rhodopirellula sp.]|nr:hypothetical protein [Rhodopirellula sp.]
MPGRDSSQIERDLFASSKADRILHNPRVETCGLNIEVRRTANSQDNPGKRKGFLSPIGPLSTVLVFTRWER